MIKVEWNVFTKKLAKWSSNVTEIFDESPVESSMAEKRSNSLDVPGWRKVGDQVHLRFVHLYAILRDDVA